MYKDLLTSSSLGTFEEILFVLENTHLSNTNKLNGLRKFCLDSTRFTRLPFNGIISLLNLLNLIEMNADSICITTDGFSFLERTKTEGNQKLLFGFLLLDSMYKSEILKEFIELINIRYDLTNNSYFIRASDCSLKYSNIRNILMELDIFKVNDIYPNLIFIDKEAITYFKDWILEVNNNKSIQDFRKKQESWIRNGLEAENFVLNFEIKRLNAHPFKSKIQRISEIDNSAGFDIISFKDNASMVHDLFIEVKSYSGTPYFYWSKNEIDLAKRLGKDYCLYLINRDEVNKKDYIPIMIEDPYNIVYSNQSEWSKEAINWFFTKII